MVKIKKGGYILAALFLVACENPTAINGKNFHAAIASHLEHTGELCLPYMAFPVEVSSRPSRSQHDLLQNMSALETVGLVRSATVAVAVDAVSGLPVQHRRYTLSETAQPFLQEKNAQQVLCWGHKKLNAIERWTANAEDHAPWESQPPSASVGYTYTVDNMAPWAEDIDMRRAFPFIKQTLINQDRVQTIRLQRTDTAWVVKN